MKLSFQGKGINEPVLNCNCMKSKLFFAYLALTPLKASWLCASKRTLGTLLTRHCGRIFSLITVSRPPVAPWLRWSVNAKLILSVFLPFVTWSAGVIAAHVDPRDLAWCPPYFLLVDSLAWACCRPCLCHERRKWERCSSSARLIPCRASLLTMALHKIVVFCTPWTAQRTQRRQKSDQERSIKSHIKPCVKPWKDTSQTLVSNYTASIRCSAFPDSGGKG